MGKGILVTGTDTGVGKTYASCLILRRLRSKGVDAGAMKPVEAGCEEGSSSVEDLIPEDAIHLVNAAGVTDDLSLVAPCRFLTPVAPMVAAKEEDRQVDVEGMLRCYRELSSLHSFLLVEGAGGILVPITRGYSFLDLWADMDLPVLVIAASKLGVINHSLLTLSAARDRGLKVAGLVLNNIDSRTDEARRTNFDALRELVPEPVIELEFGATESDIDRIVELLQC